MGERGEGSSDHDDLGVSSPPDISPGEDTTHYAALSEPIGGEDIMIAQPVTIRGQKLDWMLVMPIAILQLTEAFNASSLFSYVGFMIIDFGLTDNPDTVGMYAGLLGSSYFAGQMVSSFAWGYLADRIGKRPSLIAGSIGTLISCIAFAFSMNLWWAMIARFLNGALNGNLGIAKAYLGQVSTKETQAKAFGVIGLMWGGGSVVGGLYGGILARPAKKWAWLFSPEGVFGKFPYLLPNLVSIATVALGLLAVFIFLKEPPLSKRVKPSMRALLKNKEALLTTSHYAVFGFITVILDEAVPLFLMSKRDSGGFEFNTSRVGIVGGLTGAGAVIVLTTVYSPLARKLGMVKSYRLGLLLSIPLSFLWPLLGMFPALGDILVWLFIGCICLFRGLAMQLGFSAVMALITNSVTASMMGSAHGLGQSLVALLRTFAPFLAGTLFSWSLKASHVFPFNQFFVFALVAVVIALILAYSLLLPSSLDQPKDAVEELELSELSGFEEQFD